MFDDQTVEMLPERTVMTLPMPMRPPTIVIDPVIQTNIGIIVQVGNGNSAVLQQVNQFGFGNLAGQFGFARH